MAISFDGRIGRVLGKTGPPLGKATWSWHSFKESHGSGMPPISGGSSATGKMGALTHSPRSNNSSQAGGGPLSPVMSVLTQLLKKQKF